MDQTIDGLSSDDLDRHQVAVRRRPGEPRAARTGQTIPRWRIVVGYAFPVVVLALAPFLAWAILPLPALAAQWTVPPPHRRGITTTYVLCVVASVALVVTSQLLMGAEDTTRLLPG